MLKLLIVGDINSIHTQKWVNSLNIYKNIEVIVWTFNTKKYCGVMPSVKVYSPEIKTSRANLIVKLNYISSIFHLRRTVAEIEPNIIHIHYLSSYGVLAWLSGLKKYFISVWGHDIYNFPKKNFLFKKITKLVLQESKLVCSTSKVMAQICGQYYKGEIKVVPFGVDLEIFRNYKSNLEDSFTIGTIKTLEVKYGIDILIKAFARFHIRFPNQDKKLIIVGEGSQLKNLKLLAKEKLVNDLVEFVGKIDNNKVPVYINKFNVFCALSRDESESFGVAVVEASACERPVIATKVSGFSEVIDDSVTGIIIEKDNVISACDALTKLYFNKELREKMGELGRQKVIREYDWKNNVKSMVSLYNQFL